MSDSPSATREKEAGPRFPIVGIGASAGGLPAIEAFFSGLPADRDIGMALVIVQHLSPDHKSMLGDIVRRYAKMEVHEAADGMEVQPNRVYIIPPNADMALADGTLCLSKPNEPRGHRLPIDFFFRSLARVHRELAICVVLSGTGSDGTLGIKAVKGEGGMVMVQDPLTTEHDGMPRSAIATGLVDYVLGPADMPAQLMAYVSHAFERRKPDQRPPKAEDDILKRLTSLLRSQTGHDFSQYKSTTLVRRMERRMALHQIAAHEEYFRFARENPAEIEALFRDLLIGVTNFFRDPEAFKVLEDQVIPRLMKAKGANDAFRVWICGASSGEEAYSIAILLHEYIESSKHSIKIQVFATDIDHMAIEQARSAIYPTSIAADVTPERLRSFFVHDKEGDTYRVQKVIRDMLVFSEQDVIKDPPFSRLDLISCRNLLIYVNAELQRRLIPLFHYALNPGGALFLGTSESVGEYARLFTPADRKWKIFYRESVESEPPRFGLGELLPAVRGPRDRQRPILAPNVDPRISWRHLTEQALLSHDNKAGILINGRGDILYIVGRTGKYLEPAAGDAALNILSMAREGLRRELTTALHKVVSRRKPVEYKALRVKGNGTPVITDLTIKPVEVAHGSNSDLYLVVLEEMPETPEVANEPAAFEGGDHVSRLAELEHELRAKEDYLQTTLEEMQTTNEELKSTNEEMQSINEELQSTNEELETSKEELQSVNEELSTVNAALQDKVADLSRVNNDMNNLLAGTGIGTVFVDNSLRILRFTPAATQIINLIPSDVGRPVEHIVPNLVGYDALIDDVREVLETLLPKEAEVRTKSGSWYLMRIRPYRTMENQIEGVVLTFVDISEWKLAEEKLRESEARFHAIFNQAFAGVAEMNMEGRFTFVNSRFCEMVGYERDEMRTMTMADITHPTDRARSAVLFESLAHGGPDYSIEKRYIRRDGAVLWVADRISGIRGGDVVTSAVAVSFDLSERKRLQSDAAAADERLTGELEALSRLESVRSLTMTPMNQNAVLQEVLDTAIAINQADMGILQVCNGDRLVIAAQRGFGQDYLEFWEQAVRAGGESCSEVVRGAYKGNVEDVTKSPIFVDTPALHELLKAGVRALHSVPLITRSGTVIGLLVTHFHEPHRSDARKMRIYDLLAREVAEIIEKGRSAAAVPLVPARDSRRSTAR